MENEEVDNLSFFEISKRLNIMEVEFNKFNYEKNYYVKLYKEALLDETKKKKIEDFLNKNKGIQNLKFKTNPESMVSFSTREDRDETYRLIIPSARDEVLNESSINSRTKSSGFVFWLLFIGLFIFYYFFFSK